MKIGKNKNKKIYLNLLLNQRQMERQLIHSENCFHPTHILFVPFFVGFFISTDTRQIWANYFDVAEDLPRHSALQLELLRLESFCT